MVNRIDLKNGDYVGEYRIESLLGEGSFGIVFLAKDASGCDVAIKMLKLWAVPPDVRRNMLARFDMEFETGKIDSRFLVRSYRHGLEGEIPWFTMEYCSAGNLMTRIEQRHVSDHVTIARQILCGLRDLHRQGKVHRDLKPENVLFRADGSLALTDFGISGDRNKRLTERRIWGSPGQIFGTYAYMPPEQVAADRDATVLPTTDIFSFGVVMYLALVGRLPFGILDNENSLVEYIRRAREGKSDMSLVERHPLGKRFLPLLTACLTPDFRHRLQTASEALQMLPESSKQFAVKPLKKEDPVETHTLQLRIMQGEEYNRTYRLCDLLTDTSRILTLGRTDGVTQNSICIAESLGCYISRRHCTLELDAINHQWYIRDGQWDASRSDGWRRSTNGTFVNSMEADKNGLPITDGDIISIGEAKIKVESYEL
jgi:serine/threonine protein kinase